MSKFDRVLAVLENRNHRMAQEWGPGEEILSETAVQELAYINRVLQSIAKNAKNAQEILLRLARQRRPAKGLAKLTDFEEAAKLLSQTYEALASQEAK